MGVDVSQRVVLILGLILPLASRCWAGEPLRVFVLAGQSNMEGKAAVSTLDAVLGDVATKVQRSAGLHVRSTIPLSRLGRLLLSDG